MNNPKTSNLVQIHGSSAGNIVPINTNGMTPFQRMEARLDKYYGQTENGGNAA